MSGLQSKAPYMIYVAKVLCVLAGCLMLYGFYGYVTTDSTASNIVKNVVTTKISTTSRPTTALTTQTTAGNKPKGTLKVPHVNRALAGDFDMKIVPNHDFDGLNKRQASVKFSQYVTNFTTNCRNKQRFGKPGDGGYWICMDTKVAPKKNDCLIYSFGIRDEWSFDDALHDSLGCEVHSFDPSMKKDDHQRKKKLFFHNLGIWDKKTVNADGWKLASLTDIINMLNHQNRIIDCVKVDVEGAEWPMLKQMLADNPLKNVKQMIFEIHTPRFRGDEMTVADYGQIYRDLGSLQTQLNMKLYTESHRNYCCLRFALLTGTANCCYELFYLNSNFLGN